MSKEVLAQVVQRAISDGVFRRQLSNDPTGALRGFDLTPAETAAIRSGDSGRLSAFGIDVRLSKMFTLAAGEASYSVSSDIGASNASALQSPDAAERNSVLITGSAGSGAAVQSPDAADRNFAYAAGDAGASGAVQSPDAADRNFAYEAGDAGSAGAVQSPDAADRNLLHSIGGGEPRDIAPTDIGDNQALGGNELTGATTDEGFLPAVGYDGGEADAGGAQTPSDASDSPHLDP